MTDGARANGPAGSIGFVGVPTCLRPVADKRRWVGWSWERRNGGKWTKPPRSVIGGRTNGYARNNDPGTWATSAEGMAALAAGTVDGIGLQLLDLPRLAAIDLDDVRNPDTGEIVAWARVLIERSGSYAETTPSGTGARILGRVDLDHEPEHTSFDHPEGGKVELFVNMTSGRYITVTGAQIEGTPEKLRDVSVIVAELLALKADQERVAGEKAKKADTEWRIDTGGTGGASFGEAGVDEAREALSFVDPDLDYENWLKCLMALHAGLGDPGLPLAVEWSSKGSKFVDGEVERKWRGFKAGGGARLATVFHHAEAGGCNLSELARKYRGAAGAGPRERAAGARPGGNGAGPEVEPEPEDGPTSDKAPWSSDEALALDFAGRHAHRLRFVAAWSRWYLWSGERWAEDDTLLAFNLARAVCRDTAATCNLPSARMRVGSAKTVAAVVTLSRADRRLAASINQWDQDPWLLNTPGGVVDLPSGEVRAHRREDYMTKITAVAPGGSCDLWLRFLDRVTGGDRDLQGYLQRLVGYSLTGSTREHVLPFAHGSGGNGKGVFIGALAGVLGDYHKTAPIETFAASSGDRHPTELAMLRGARLVTAQETEEGRRWAESKIKTLTGGDRIAARFMRGDFFEFEPQFTLLLAGNHKPGLRSVDEAIRRRFHLIPFTVTIGPDERDEQLPEKLKAEWPGILQWAVEGCLAWQRGGLAPPAVIRAATDAYLDGQDSLGAWIDEACDINPNAWTPRTELFASWQAWAERAREFVLPRVRFYEALETRGFADKRESGKGTRGFQGLSVRQHDYSEAHWNR